MPGDEDEMKDLSLKNTARNAYLEFNEVFAGNIEHGIYGSIPPEDLHVMLLGMLDHAMILIKVAIQKLGTSKRLVRLDLRAKKLNSYFSLISHPSSVVEFRPRRKGVTNLSRLAGKLSG